MQPGPELLMSAPTSGSEDCLFVNIWRSDTREVTPQPVLVYIHGGAGISGKGSDWNGARLASLGHAVVVTFNHRLGPFGFLAHPELTREDPEAPSNFGILDQIAVLEWVQENIATFGGDPKRVTVFGHSAGGHFASALVSSPKAAGLFSAAIIQSGTPSASRLEEAERDGVEVARKLECEPEDQLGCLRAASVVHLSVAAQANKQPVFGYASWGAVVDGKTLPRQIIETVQLGEHNHVPMIIGTTSTEFLPFQMLIPDTMSEADVRRSLRWLGPRVDRALHLYPISKFKSPAHALAAMMSDRDIICPSSRLAEAASHSQAPPIWRYVFSHGFDLPPASVPGVHHGIDRYFLFPDPSGLRHLAAREEALSDTMIRYWGRFASSGDPNGGSDPLWPSFDAESRQFLRLDTPMSVGEGDRPSSCDFWEASP